MIKNSSASRSRGKFFIFVVLLISVVTLLRYFHAHEELGKWLDWISGLGLWGALVYFVIYVTACVLMVPGSILTLGAGFIYGVFWGSILVMFSATLGATAAFLVGRYFARDWVRTKIEAYPKFKAVDRAVGREGWKIVGLTRLSPLFPFNIQNYLYALTPVSLKHYFFATWIGMIPATIMYVTIGSVAGDLATLGGDGRERSLAEWILYMVGLLAAIACAVYVTAVARKALREVTGPQPAVKGHPQR